MNAVRHVGRAWWWVTAALVIASSVMYMHLAKQIATLQEWQVAIDSQAVRAAEIQAEVSAAVDTPPRRHDALTVSSRLDDGTMDVVNRIRQFKQRKSNVDPAIVAADLNNRMAKEPPLADTERRHARWLNDTLEEMPADAPDAGSVKTTCEGRRCRLSAVFASDQEAKTWARRYLLEGGGKLLAQSSTVIIPLGGADEPVALELYFY